MLDYVSAMAANLLSAGPRLIVLFIAIGLFWKILSLTAHAGGNANLLKDRNYAYVLQRMSLILAFTIATLPSVSRVYVDTSWWKALAWQSAEIAWVFIALLLAQLALSKLVLLGVNVNESLKRGNVAVGIVGAGFYIGLGFILNGSLTGASPTWSQGLLSTVVFGSLGLIVLIGVFYLHEVITPWHLRHNIRDGKVVAALEVAGMLAAAGIAVRTGVAGDFTSWDTGLVAFFATVAVTIGLLYLSRWLVDLMVLRGFTVSTIQRDDMVAASAVLAGMFIIVALPVSALVAYQL